MNRRNTLGAALVVLAAVLFVLPALVPVQPVLSHDTRPGAFDGPEQLEEQNVTIVAYENLSERGQDLYVQALETDGEYRVPTDRGAPDFEYLTAAERQQTWQEHPGQRPGTVAVERPESASLPPADEPGRHAPSDDRNEEYVETAQRYDLMDVSEGPPPLNATSQLLRLAAVVLAVVSAAVGGYLLASKSG